MKKSAQSSFEMYKVACEAAVRLVLADGFVTCTRDRDWREPLGEDDMAYLFRFAARKAQQDGRKLPVEYVTVRVRFTGLARNTIRAAFVTTPDQS